MGLPRLNLLCPAALAGFCYRALAGTAQAANAALTSRKLEDLQRTKTDLMLSLSAQKSDVQISKQRLIQAGQNAEDAELDLRIFNNKHPALPPKKGIFSKRPSPEQQATEHRRLDFAQISKHCDEDYSAQKKSAAKLAKELKQQDKALSRVIEKQGKQTRKLSSQIAAEVINKVIAGDADSARRRLQSLRQMSRGNLMLGTLSVIVELLATGPGAARQALSDARLIFEQHPDPATRVLEGLICVVEGQAGLELNPGEPSYESYSSRKLYCLSQLVAALGGWHPDNTVLEETPFYAMLVGIYESRGAGLGPTTWDSYPEDYLVETARMNDLVVQTLVCSSYLLPEKRLWLLSATGLAQIKFFHQSNPYESPRPLLDIIKRHENPAWPKKLTKPWQLALACLALLGASVNAPEDIFEQWLEESYNWPKSDLYWWVLAEIKQDKALLNNISRKPTELFTVDQL